MFTLLFRSVCLKSRYLKGVQKCNHQLIWVIAGLRFEACLNPQRGVVIGKSIMWKHLPMCPLARH